MSLKQLVKCALAGVLTLGSDVDDKPTSTVQANMDALSESGSAKTLIARSGNFVPAEINTIGAVPTGIASQTSETIIFQGAVGESHSKMVASIDQFMYDMGSAIGHNADRFWLNQILEIKARLVVFERAMQGMVYRSKGLTERLGMSDPLHLAAGRRLGRVRPATSLEIDEEPVLNTQLGNVERLLRRVYCKVDATESGPRPECHPNANAIFKAMLKAREATDVMGDEEKAMFSYLESNLQNDAMRDESVILVEGSQAIHELVQMLNGYDHEVRGTVDSSRDGVFEYPLQDVDIELHEDMDAVEFSSLKVGDVTQGLPMQVIPYHSSLTILAYELREASRVIAGIDAFKEKAKLMLEAIKLQVAHYKKELADLMPNLPDEDPAYLVLPEEDPRTSEEIKKHEATRRRLIVSAKTHANRSKWVLQQVDLWVPSEKEADVEFEEAPESKTRTDSLKLTASPHANDIHAAVQCLVFDGFNGAAGAAMPIPDNKNMCSDLDDIMAGQVEERVAEVQ